MPLGGQCEIQWGRFWNRSEMAVAKVTSRKARLLSCNSREEQLEDPAFHNQADSREAPEGLESVLGCHVVASDRNQFQQA